MKVVVEFYSITSRQSSSVMSRTATEWVRSLVKRRYPPALLTRISIFPSSLMVSRAARLAPSLVVSSALTVWARRPRARIPNPRRPTPKECELQWRHPLPRGRRPKPWSVPIRGPLRLPGRLCLPVVSLLHLSEMARTAFQAARRHTKPRACVVVHYPEQSLPSYTLPKKKEGLLYARLCTKIVGDHEDRRAHLFDFGRILFIGRTLAGL